MKIDIVLGPFLSLPPNPTGAVERIWQDMAVQFSRKGHAVRLIGKALEQTSIESLKYISLRGEERSGSLAMDILKDIRYANIVAAQIKDPDIVVTNTFSLPIVLNAKRKCGARFKIVVNLARMPKGQLFLYRNADRIAAVSSAVIQEIKKQDRVVYKNSVVVENPIDCDIFNPDGRRERWGTERRVLYAGRISREKGLDLLIESIKKIQNSTQYKYRLRIVGPYEVEQGGDGSVYLDELKRRGRELPVEFVGPIWDKKRLADEYKKADIFVYPSTAEMGETFGVAPLEAMACGAVTIVSNLVCFTQYLQDGVNGLAAHVVGNDEPADAIGDCIYKLETLSRYRSFQKNGIETAQKYDNRAIADKYLSAFREISIVE